MLHFWPEVFFSSFKYGVDKWFLIYLPPFSIAYNLETWFAIHQATLICNLTRWDGGGEICRLKTSQLFSSLRQRKQNSLGATRSEGVVNSIPIPIHPTWVRYPSVLGTANFQCQKWCVSCRDGVQSGSWGRSIEPLGEKAGQGGIRCFQEEYGSALAAHFNSKLIEMSSERQGA